MLFVGGSSAAPRATPRPAPEKSCRLLETEALVGGLLDRSGSFLGRNSFVSGTPVLTPSGMRPMEEIRVGDLVAAIDESTGAAVSRRVTAVFSRSAGEVVTLTLASDDGREAVVGTTAGHPFNVEGWRGAANDNGGPFPSAGKTPFGEWVRAGALGAGDRLSTLHSGWVRDRVLLKVANDDGQPDGGRGDGPGVEVMGSETRKGSFRVYNLEVESGGAQITSNYVVGDFWTWVHNNKRYVRVWLKKQVVFSPLTASFIRGWYIQQINAGCSWSRTRNPPGFDWGHLPSRSASLGFNHGVNSRLENSDMNRR